MAEYTRIEEVEVGSSHLADHTYNDGDLDRHDEHEHGNDAFEPEDLPLSWKELDEKRMTTITVTDDISDSDSDSDVDDMLDMEKQNRQYQQQQQQSSSFTPKWNQYKSYGSAVKSFCITALPRFCQPGGLRLQKEPHPTAWLDALRGYAAWIVFQYHCFNSYDPSWRRQPFISILFAGPGMVALFFVISGYVLSYGLLKQMRNRQSSSMLESLASSTFRRYMRLYASSVVATMFAFILVRLRWYNGAGLWVPGFFDQVGHWLYDTAFFINPFGDVRGWYHGGTQNSHYLGTLWTIPVEFRGSMILFGFCAAVCKLSTPWRMALTWWVIVMCYLWNTVFVAEFLFGMFVADLSLLRNPDRLSRRPATSASASATLPITHPPTRLEGNVAPQNHHAPTSRIVSWGRSLKSIRIRSYNNPQQPEKKGVRIAKNIAYTLLFILGIFILGQPDGTDLGVWGQFPWQFLKRFIPFYYTNGAQSYFYLSMGGFFVVLALDSFPALQRPLTCGFSQYVGDLSFGIYALHPPLTVAFFRGWAEPMRVKYLGNSAVAYIPGYIAMTLLVFVAADYFTRLDKKVVRLGRWLQVRLFRKWD